MTKPSTTTQTQELEPCPFCGVVPAMQSHTDKDEMEGRFCFFVERGNGTCPIAIVSTGGPFKDATKAATAWNTRALTDEVTRLREALQLFTDNGRCFVIHTNTATDDYFECLFCRREGPRWREVPHNVKCPIAIARAALQPKAEQEQEKLR